MKYLFTRTVRASLWLSLFLSTSASAQSGGQFKIEQSVIANGGGSSSVGTITVAGTNSQPVAGTRSASTRFGIHGGFWQDTSLAPSAAYVSVAGRVLTSTGQGIRNVTITITEFNGAIRTATTGSLGLFCFDTVEAGQTLVISVSAKRYAFVQPTIVLNIDDAVDDLTFVAESQ